MTQQAFSILPNPFPGLRPFRTEETHLFFGREGQIDEVLEKMQAHRFVAILGTSGSGKSSFMYCGLVPSLHGGFMDGSGVQWRIVVSRPGLSPIDNLSQAITEAELPGAAEQERRTRHHVNQAILRSSSLGLVELAGRLQQSPDEHLLILIDQFEELFRFQQEKDEGHANETLAFIKLLTQAVGQRGLPIYVVMTMRSDYIGDCAQFPIFTKMINDSHYLIPQMTRDQKRQAILGPVAVGGGQMTSRLVQQLLNDLGDNPDQLPILQHALMRTWDFWLKHAKVEERLDLFHYEAIGGMAEALSMHANEAYEELDIEQQQLCARIFKCLTEKGGDGRGIRRPTRLRDIAAITEASEAEVLSIVDRFRQQGRTLLMPPMSVPAHGDTVIDISHESLMRIWTTLREWVQEESDSVKMYLRLAEAGAMYQRGTSSLWRPPDLQVAMAWEEKQRPNQPWGIRHDPAYERTMTFLELSKQAYEEEQRGKEKMQKKRLQRTRLVALALGLAAIVSAFFLVYARLQTLEARKNLELATQSQQEANEQRKLAEGNAQQANEEKQRATEQANRAEEQRLQAEAERRRAEIATRQALDAQAQAEKSATEAKSAQAQAETSAAEAARQRELSDKNATLAKEQEQQARREREYAQQLRFKAIAQAMAVKSRQLEDTLLQARLAYQAYRFNQTYNKGLLDADIYSALHDARRKLEGEAFNAFVGHGDVVNRLAVAGNKLYTVSHDGRCFRWDLSSQQGAPVFESKHLLREIAMKPGSEEWAAGTQDGLILLPSAQGLPTNVPAHPGGVWGLLFSPDGQSLVSFGADYALRCRKADGSGAYTIAQLGQPLRSVVWGKQGKLLGLLNDGSVGAWHLAASADSVRLVPPQGAERGRSLALSNDGETLAIGMASGKVLLWDLPGRKAKQVLGGHSAAVSQIAFSPDGRWMATASFDGSVLLWDLEKLAAPAAIFGNDEGWVWSVAFSADSRQVVAASGQGDVRRYALDLGTHAEALAKQLKRPLDATEWGQYVGKDIPYAPAAP